MSSVNPQPSENLESDYTLDNAWQRARQRLDLLASIADPGTVRHFESIGVAPGWRCLELGGGGGSIAGWLYERVGAQGQVFATDVDTRFLDGLNYPNLNVRAHNVETDSIAGGAFDLVHARALLVHLAAREQVLDKMVAALRPGGWLLVEEPDYISKTIDPANDAEASSLFQRVRSAQIQALAEAGNAPSHGRRLYGALRRRGLEDVGGEGRIPVTHGGSDAALFYRLTAEQLRERLLGSGVTPEEFDAYLRLHDDPGFVFVEGAMMAAWGRRPALQSTRRVSRPSAS